MNVLELKAEVLILLPVSGEKCLEEAVTGREHRRDRRDMVVSEVLALGFVLVYSMFVAFKSHSHPLELVSSSFCGR